MRVRILFYTRASLTPIQIPCFDEPSVNVCVFFQRAQQLRAARHIVLSRLHYSIEPSLRISPLLRVQNNQYSATLCRRWLCAFRSKSRAQCLCVGAHFVKVSCAGVFWWSVKWTVCTDAHAVRVSTGKNLLNRGNADIRQVSRSLARPGTLLCSMTPFVSMIDSECVEKV